MERICQLLEAYRVPVLSLEGYEADDVIGTLARQGVEAGTNVVIVSGDKDFQQLVRPGVWLLNPGRGGPASVEEQWVGVENANERLGVPPDHVTDYLALVGDSSDNVPGVQGIGDKTARELVEEFGILESILAPRRALTKKRPREALLEHAGTARLSKELVTIRDDLPMTLDARATACREPAIRRACASSSSSWSSRRSYEGHVAPTAAAASELDATPKYATVDRATHVDSIALERHDRARATGAVHRHRYGDRIGAGQPAEGRSTSLACSSASRSPSATGEAYYLPARASRVAAAAGRPAAWRR